MTSVWPALWPPWKRTTTSARSLSQSTILPLPSSPHWAPITATLAICLIPFRHENASRWRCRGGVSLISTREGGDEGENPAASFPILQARVLLLGLLRRLRGIARIGRRQHGHRIGPDQHHHRLAVLVRAAHDEGARHDPDIREALGRQIVVNLLHHLLAGLFFFDRRLCPGSGRNDEGCERQG